MLGGFGNRVFYSHIIERVFTYNITRGDWRMDQIFLDAWLVAFPPLVSHSA